MKLYNEMQVAIRTTDGQMCTKDFPLGYMSYWNTTKQAQTTRDRMLGWAGGRNNPNFPIHTFKNEPVQGFTFERVASRYSTSNKLFRVNDPRGFTVEITADNMMEILRGSDIHKGTIQGPCLWYNSGHLVDVTGEVYQKELEAAKAQKAINYVPMAKVSPGDVVEVKNGTKYVYLGKLKVEFEMKASKRNYYSSTPSQSTTELDLSKAMHVYGPLDIKKNEWMSFRAVRTPDKILNIVESRGEQYADDVIDETNMLLPRGYPQKGDTDRRYISGSSLGKPAGFTQFKASRKGHSFTHKALRLVKP